MSKRGQQNADGKFASLTIQTNPEQAQALIDAITKMEKRQAPGYSAFLGSNCATLIEDVLKDVGLDFGAQSLCATGLIQNYRGSPEMIVRSRQQISH